MSELVILAKTSLDAAQTTLAHAKAHYEKAKINVENAKQVYEAALVSAQNAHTPERLCALCTTIDFDALFKSDIKGLKHASTMRRVIGNLFNTVECQYSCLCCRFLLEACQLGRDPAELYLHRFAEQKHTMIYFCEDPESKPWYTQAGIASDTPQIPYFWVQVGQPNKTGEPHVCITLERASLQSTTEPVISTSKFYASPRMRSQVEAFNGSINMHVIEQWIDICNHHDMKCSRPTPQDVTFFLIDVHTRHIVKYSSGCRYIALSYVWGKGAQTMYHREHVEGSPLDVSSTEWKVPYPAAQTIEDAMRLVKNLGEKYLWTDLYCIDQHDNVTKQEQIMKMDRIYASSYLTIVALDGENADWGLPGISRPLEHTKQPTLTLGRNKLMATYIFSIYHHLGKSKWDSRAWTLQERLLSSRCVIFGKSSISMRCQREAFHDLMQTSTTDGPSRVLTKLGEEQYWEDGSTIDLRETEWDYKHYDAFISTYTGRNLTDQADALNACRGVLNMITRNTGQTFVYGLPMQDFHRALLWKPHHENIITRRLGFPSWSWAGWIGRIEHAYWIGDMADYAGEDTQRPKKRNRISKPVNMNPAISADFQDLPHTETKSGRIRVRSEVARFCLHLQRVDGELHAGRKHKSLHPSHAVGDHWTVVAGEAGTRKLRDTASEHEVFQSTDFFFRMHPQYRTALTDFTASRRRAEFLLVERWLRIRDSKTSNRWRENMVSALLINKLADGTYERLASILIPWEEWKIAKPCRQVVELA